MSRKQWAKDFERINRKYEEKYFPKVKGAIKHKTSSLTKTLKEKGFEAARHELSTDLVNAELSSIVRKLYLEVGLHHARRTDREIKSQVRRKKHKSVPFETKGFGFNETWTAFILNYLEEFLLQKITFDVNENTRRKLLDVIDEAIAEGWGIDKTVEKIDHLPFTESQAARIVRTEINRAANTGSMAAVDTSDYQMNKEWIAAHDRRTRGNPVVGQKDHANHWALDGQVIDYEDTFVDSRNGDRLSFPGDPKGSAASTVNCRCTIAVIAKEDENGQLVPKPQASVGTVIPIYQRPAAAASPFSLNTTGRA